MKRMTIFTVGVMALAAFMTYLIVVTFAQPTRPGKSPVEMMDTNGDGYLSEEELTSQCEKDEGRRSERKDMLFQLLSNHN